MLMHAIAHMGIYGYCKSLHWKLAVGEKSLAAPGNWTCVSSVPAWCSTELHPCPLGTYFGSFMCVHMHACVYVFCGVCVCAFKCMCVHKCVCVFTKCVCITHKHTFFFFFWHAVNYGPAWNFSLHATSATGRWQTVAAVKEHTVCYDITSSKSAMISLSRRRHSTPSLLASSSV